MRISYDINNERINGFLTSLTKSNIFQTPEMFWVYKNTRNYEPVFLSVNNDDKEILGILLAVIQKEHSGLLGSFSARSIIWGGPLVKDDNPEILDFLLKEYNKRIKKKAIYTQFRNLWNWSESEKQIFEMNGFHYDAHLDILIDLKKPEDELWSNLKSQARNKIRKATKEGLTFNKLSNKEEVKEVYDILEKVYRKAKLPIPDLSLFSNAYDVLKEHSMIDFFVANFQGKIIGARIVFFYKNKIYDWFAGSDSKYYKYNPNDYLPWKILQWAKENGYNTFDFGGAGKPNEPYGVRDYKMKFGGELVEFGRFEKVHKPILMKLGQFGMVIYKILK